LTRADRKFNFSNASIGNFFFTGIFFLIIALIWLLTLLFLFYSGARLFFGSLEAAICFFHGITHLPPLTEVIPILSNSFDRNILGAVLQNGQIIVGQSEISHPVTTQCEHG